MNSADSLIKSRNQEKLKTSDKAITQRGMPGNYLLQSKRHYKNISSLFKSPDGDASLSVLSNSIADQVPDGRPHHLKISASVSNLPKIGEPLVKMNEHLTDHLQKLQNRLR